MELIIFWIYDQGWATSFDFWSIPESKNSQWSSFLSESAYLFLYKSILFIVLSCRWPLLTIVDLFFCSEQTAHAPSSVRLLEWKGFFYRWILFEAKFIYLPWNLHQITYDSIKLRVERCSVLITILKLIHYPI